MIIPISPSGPVDEGEQLAVPRLVLHPRLADSLRPGRHRPGRPGVEGTASGGHCYHVDG